MALQGIFTNEGIIKAIEAENNEGFRIRPVRFAVSEIAGDLNPNRDGTTVSPIWYQGPISSVYPITDPITGDMYMQFNCNIPSGSSVIPRYTREIYLYAVDANTSTEYLLAISQPSTELTYDPDGELRLRLNLKIANANLETLFEFLYTQATEIEDHNMDINAHPAIRKAVNKAGIYLTPASNKYNGQNFDAFPVISPNVIHKSVVYFHTTNNRYELAMSDTNDESQYAVGIYLSDEDIVVSKGIVDHANTLPPYTPIYLSNSIPGSITYTPTTIILGYTLPNNKMMVDIVPNRAVASDVNLDGDLTLLLHPANVRELTLLDENNIPWDIKITNEGILYAVPYSSRTPDPIFRIPKINLSFAQITISGEGELIVNSPPLDITAVDDSFYYIESPDGISWKFTVNLQNEIVMVAHRNSFLIKSEDTFHFSVQQSDPANALTYVQVYNQGTLPTTPIVISRLAPFCFYNNGTGVFPVYYANGWKYFHDNSTVS